MKKNKKRELREEEEISILWTIIAIAVLAVLLYAIIKLQTENTSTSTKTVQNLYIPKSEFFRIERLDTPREERTHTLKNVTISEKERMLILIPDNESQAEVASAGYN